MSIGETEDHIVERQTSGGAVAHAMDLFARQLSLGEKVAITYINGQAGLRPARERTETKELGG